jgi:glycosyltransferase involved in cell wall biosynthesis|tara:strand:- start:102 stop:986 length:885 start_codon:yes stop_codon:yes gene_type:complete
MKPIKISIFGADGNTCQVPRIKEGMKQLKHILSEDSPDLIYSNDPSGYEKAMLLKKKFPESCLILNFLDVPWHMPNIRQQTSALVKYFLDKADAVTTISYRVKKDLIGFFNKKIEVIYNPVKDVFYDQNIKKNNTFLYVGRANDKVKRINLVKESLQKIEGSTKNIKICGTENPGFGNYLGVVNDNELNKLYNSSKYLYLTSKSEGLGLTMIEAMICGSVPIVCEDNETAKEFLPKDFICQPDPQSIINKIRELDKEYDEKRKLALLYGQKYKIQFDKVNIAKNILNIFYSKAI